MATDNLPEYPPVHHHDVEIIKTAAPEVLAAIHRLLMSGHAGDICPSNPEGFCYLGVFRKFSLLVQGIDRIRNAA